MLSLNINNKNIVTLKKDGKFLADIVFKNIKTGKKISVGTLNKKSAGQSNQHNKNKKNLNKV
ncbi:TPA: hypothetical protein ACSVRT_002187 [Clostridioides difficile]|uniref:hypothetical protein n=1 Tax=Clostridioides difficile TaxID=1496 RepID=UPI001034D8BA|nr:hypothetical protein [Clostridioides difficile]MDX5782103.1 hypothetical protein [Clostridioides difficile]